MWHDMFVTQIPFIEKILRTGLVYAASVVIFRVAGKRGLANLNALDLTVLLLPSNGCGCRTATGSARSTMVGWNLAVSCC